jgi:GDP-4-dehydro-6-deoxy-D-mannose reductase
MRALITGVNGFAGPHLAAHLLETCPEVELWGQAWGDHGRDVLLRFGTRLRVRDGDLGDASSLQTIVAEARPQVLYHLAAASSVASSWSDPAQVLRINAIGQINLFEALRSAQLSPVTVVASSAEVYGRGPGTGEPLSETMELQPVSPYAVSKATQDLIASQYHAAYGLPTVRLRLFNHTGPGQLTHFVASSFAHQIAEIEKGRREPTMAVGNLDVSRDFTDVRDIARAYQLAAHKGQPGQAYNVCSGRALSIREMLDTLLDLSPAEVEVVTDPDRYRAAEVAVLLGDHTRFTEATGWQPQIPLRRTLADLLDWWRDHV